MRLRTLGNGTSLQGKRVLVRIDANVPLKGGKVVDGPHGKIARAAVDLEWLRQHGARTIVMTHVGRPEGRRVSAYSVRPIARRLSELLGTRIAIARTITGPAAERMVQHMKPGDVVLLENVRFDAREERNSTSFAQELARLGDLYVNDAFAVSHRAHASVDAITSELSSYAGPLLANEVGVLSKIMKHPKRPSVLVMGGLKMRDKLPVMERWLPHVDRVIVGGALATCFLKAQGWEIGASVYDKEGVAHAKKLIKKAKDKIMLPADVVLASGLRERARARHAGISEVGPKEMIVDIGKRSMRMFLREIQGAKTIVWNGPFGYCEVKQFCEGTNLLARAIAARTDKAVTVVGGGDTVPILESLGLADRFTLLSTGGGAMLEFLAGKTLPGVDALLM